MTMTMMVTLMMMVVEDPHRTSWIENNKIESRETKLEGRGKVVWISGSREVGKSAKEAGKETANAKKGRKRNWKSGKEVG